MTATTTTTPRVATVRNITSAVGRPTGRRAFRHEGAGWDDGYAAGFADGVKTGRARPEHALHTQHDRDGEARSGRFRTAQQRRDATVARGLGELLPPSEWTPERAAEGQRLVDAAHRSWGIPPRPGGAA